MIQINKTVLGQRWDIDYDLTEHFYVPTEDFPFDVSQVLKTKAAIQEVKDFCRQLYSMEEDNTTPQPPFIIDNVLVLE